MATFEYNGEVMARALLSHHLKAALEQAEPAGLAPLYTLALRALAAHAAAEVAPAWAVVPEEAAAVKESISRMVARPSPSNPFNRTSGNGSKPPVRRKEAAEILGVSLKTLDRFVARRVLKPTRSDNRGVLFDPVYLKGIDARALMLRKPRK
jgi:hypothetical protein